MNPEAQRLKITKANSAFVLQSDRTNKDANASASISTHKVNRRCFFMVSIISIVQFYTLSQAPPHISAAAQSGGCGYPSYPKN
jgi:hypothetical protein